MTLLGKEQKIAFGVNVVYENSKRFEFGLKLTNSLCLDITEVEIMSLSYFEHVGVWPPPEQCV